MDLASVQNSEQYKGGLRLLGVRRYVDLILTFTDPSGPAVKCKLQRNDSPEIPVRNGLVRKRRWEKNTITEPMRAGLWSN